MKQKLSKREKVLLFASAIVLFYFVAFRFVLGPAFDNYSAAMDEYDKLSYEKLLIDSRFDTESLIVKSHEDAKKAYDKTKKRYPDVMSNEDIDKILTGICLENRLIPMMLAMEEKATFMSLSQIQGGSEGAAAIEDGDGVLAFTAAVMNLSGSYDSLKGLIDTVDDMDYVRLNKITFSNSSGAGSVAGSNISVNFEITMIDDAE